LNVLKRLVVALVSGLALCPLPGVTQISARPPNLIETLNKEAGASDPAGIYSYSQHLLSLLANEKVEAMPIASFSDRLARAELLARRGKRSHISSVDIAAVFNDLMKNVNAPQSMRADAAPVEKMRVALERMAPNLVLQRPAGESCYPGEAVFLVFLLIANDGTRISSVADKVSPDELPQMITRVRPSTDPSARSLVDAYISRNPAMHSFELFNHVGNKFEF